MKSRLVALLVFLASVCAAQPPQAPGYWAWMGGRALVSNVAPVYGTKFQFAPGNWPGQRDGAVTWTDKNGRFWLFGGSRGSLVSCANYLNDLWAFDPKLGAHGQWAWMGGTKPVTCVNNTSLVSAGAYGTEYQFADGNLPYGRSNATTAVDSAGRLWLFSGFAADSGLSLWSLGDLWVFYPAKGAHGQWAWMGGDRAAS